MPSKPPAPTVPKGALYCSGATIEDCRLFLREAGLKATSAGWRSEDRLGAIYYEHGWIAAHWQKEEKPK
jgi:hypothetical protein